MKKSDLLLAIQKYNFYAVELNLYLDNFPNCTEAKEDLKVISQKLNALICEYEEHYGPFTNFGHSNSTDMEKWLCGPWPWENER